MSSTNREQQIAEAEELLGDSLAKASFAKALFFGRCLQHKLHYPHRDGDAAIEQAVVRLRNFCQEHIDAAAIDRQAEIPRGVIEGLGKLGVLGACLPVSCGGLGYTQTQYCRLVEVLGGHCAGTALFVNAHHSIGPRALVLFGTPDQQRKWLPKLAAGEWISAFALTETEAGSDAGNVQTRAEPTPDGRGYMLNGHKRWITNGGIAQLLTVMARTPLGPSGDGGPGESKITAFLVTPDMPGFEVVEARMEKCGVRGTATARLAFHDMFVPRENVLGQPGKGLKIALTVLDFGRTTFGASCTGAAKTCLSSALAHAASRVQFGQPLASFELVQEKLAFMGAATFAMEAATYQTAALIDAGQDDYMLETAMLKIFATESLWRIVNDTIQIVGGKAYFTDEPYERMMRDARINMIGEGANDVLRVFVALAGLRDVGLELKSLRDAVRQPIGRLGSIGRFAARNLGLLLAPPAVEVRRPELQADADALGRLVRHFAWNVEKLLARHRESVLDRQHHLGRIADAAIELYVSSCVLARLDAADSHAGGSHQLSHDGFGGQDELTAGRYYVCTAARRIRRALADLWDNDDGQTSAMAGMLIQGGKTH